MTKDELLTVLEKPYNQTEWLKTLRDVFGPGNYYPRPQAIALPANDLADAAYELGSFTTATDQRLVGVYEVTLKPGVRIEGKRVGLRQLLRPIYKLVDGALVVFTGDDGTWRFSYISEIYTYDAAGNRQEEKTDAKRYTYVLGWGVHARTPADRFAKLAIKRPAGLSLKDITEAFSVDALTKDFYRELSDWYFWAREKVTFPDTSLPRDPADSDAKHREKVAATSTIRLITRLMFVWFIKQKGLVPDAMFREEEIEKLIKGFQPRIDPGMFKPAESGDSTESTYYKAILQNLFFATLNTEMNSDERKFKKDPVHREKTDFRYQRFFKGEEGKASFLSLIQQIPFLNGGLFDCLDSPNAQGDRIDCFTDPAKNESLLAVPDYLFFGEDKIVNLNVAYGDTKHGKQTVRGLLRLLSRYNFTVEENTPVDVEVALDPELLGKVFENLLASFNPETETTARKQTGSFYTPREIVEYMVDESLKAYLNQCLTEKHPGADHTDQLADLFNYSSTETNFTDAERQTLVNALYDCKVLDPACGSGAFPLGMLQRMVHLLFKLDAKNEYLVKKAKAVAEKEFGEALTDVPVDERKQRIDDIEKEFQANTEDYNRKLVLIEQCLHGVDIQPIAVQITKLRFFISLVVEQEPTTDRDKNRGIRPLPNLETKFVAANTLIGLDRQGGTIRDLRIDKLEAELDAVRHQHFRARTRKTKKTYRDKDAELRTQIANILRGSGWKATVADQLANWNPYDQNCSADFFDTEWMFSLSKGFDIVIGNPPYVSHDKIAKDERNYYKAHYETFEAFADLYCYFVERSIRLCTNGGCATLITSNSFLKSDYGKPLRQFAIRNTINQLINIQQSQIFESAIVNVAILTLSKGQHLTPAVIVNGEFDYQTPFREFVSNTMFKYDQSDFKTQTWPLIRPEGLGVLQRMADNNKTLEGYNTKIRLGLATGDNNAFVINESERKDFIEKDGRNADIIKPVLRGRDIFRYSYKTPELYILLTKNGINVEQDYPVVYRYFDSLGTAFKKRGAKGQHWTNLRACSFFEDFKLEKIIWIELADRGRFALSTNETYLLNSGYFLIPPKGLPANYLLSVLNSHAIQFFLENIAETSGMGTSRWINNYVKEFPIPAIPETNQLPFIRIVDYILFLKAQPLSVDDQIVPAYFEQVIDGLVYELYFEAELHRAGCRFHEHLRQLPDVTALSSDAEKLALCRRVFAQLYDPGHPVRLSLFNLDTVPEVAIIEGKKG